MPLALIEADESQAELAEPTFTLRAQDVFAPFAVREYAAMLRSCAAGMASAGMNESAATVRAKAAGAEAIASAMIAWQSRNAESVKIPD